MEAEGAWILGGMALGSFAYSIVHTDTLISVVLTISALGCFYMGARSA